MPKIGAGLIFFILSYRWSLKLPLYKKKEVPMLLRNIFRPKMAFWDHCAQWSQVGQKKKFSFFLKVVVNYLNISEIWFKLPWPNIFLDFWTPIVREEKVRHFRRHENKYFEHQKFFLKSYHMFVIVLNYLIRILKTIF